MTQAESRRFSPSYMLQPAANILLPFMGNFTNGVSGVVRNEHTLRGQGHGMCATALLISPPCILLVYPKVRNSPTYACVSICDPETKLLMIFPSS